MYYLFMFLLGLFVGKRWEQMIWVNVSKTIYRNHKVKGKWYEVKEVPRVAVGQEEMWE